MPNRSAVFVCPECQHEDESVDFNEPVSGSERGSYSIDDDHHEYDGDTDLDRNGERNYSCRECGNEIDFDEMQRHINRPPEQPAAELAVAESTSAVENEGPDNVRIMDLKSDATGDAISATQTRECHNCLTLIAANGKNKFVVCTNPKCGFEFDKTAPSFITLTPRIRSFSPSR
jgi:hypothetical protein